MIVRKLRGQEKLSKILLSPSEVAVVKKMGIPLDVWVKQQLLLIAKRRRWTWYLNKEKNT